MASRGLFLASRKKSARVRNCVENFISYVVTDARVKLIEGSDESGFGDVMKE